MKKLIFKYVAVAFLLVGIAACGNNSESNGSSDSTSAPIKIKNAALTTCALGGTCVVGDIGPGGGTVFYVAPTTFVASPLFIPLGPVCRSACKYLEVAPTIGNGAWTDVIAKWGCPGTFFNTQTGIGTGFLNTLKITSCADYSTGAKIARAYRGPNTKTDWFLPSFSELNELCKFALSQPTGNSSVDCATTGTRKSGFNESSYLSSTSYEYKYYPNKDALSQQFGPGGHESWDRQYGYSNVRPIRAFSATN